MVFDRVYQVLHKYGTCYLYLAIKHIFDLSLFLKTKKLETSFVRTSLQGVSLVAWSTQLDRGRGSSSRRRRHRIHFTLNHPVSVPCSTVVNGTRDLCESTTHKSSPLHHRLLSTARPEVFHRCSTSRNRPTLFCGVIAIVVVHQETDGVSRGGDAPGKYDAGLFQSAQSMETATPPCSKATTGRT